MRVCLLEVPVFIDSHLVEKLMENEENEVIVVDNYFTGSKDNLKKIVVVDGRDRLMEGENTGPINVGNPGEFTALELTETAKELINPKVGIKMVENTPDDLRQKKPYIAKAKELLGWEPKVKLRDGLPLTEEDFRSRLGVSDEKK